MLCRMTDEQAKAAAEKSHVLVGDWASVAEAMKVDPEVMIIAALRMLTITYAASIMTLPKQEREEAVDAIKETFPPAFCLGLDQDLRSGDKMTAEKLNDAIDAIEKKVGRKCPPDVRKRLAGNV